MSGPLSALLPDGRRLHLQHGPIDLIVEAFGAAGEIKRAYGQAIQRFDTVLDELVAELGELRRPTTPRTVLQGDVARRMASATRPHCAGFVTPMAAVAGAVADEVLAALVAERPLTRAYVNNGGDIAIYLRPGTTFDVGMATQARPQDLAGRLAIGYDDAVRGIATSGQRGRSLSLGIADSVTVLAETAAAADAAATLIANVVDLPGHPAIKRRPACELAPDSDLGDRPVTVDVGPLSSADIRLALENGRQAARQMKNRGLIAAASLGLQGQVVLLGDEAGCDQTVSPEHGIIEKEVVHA